MYTKTCAISNIEFRTEDSELDICPAVREKIMYCVKKDIELRKYLIEEICRDQHFIKMLVVSMLSFEVSSVGLEVPGTVGEFFIGLFDKRNKK